MLKDGEQCEEGVKNRQDPAGPSGQHITRDLYALPATQKYKGKKYVERTTCCTRESTSPKCEKNHVVDYCTTYVH